MSKEDNLLTIGDRIRFIRSNEKLSQSNFGKTIDLKQTIIGQYETGTRNVPERTINMICEKYNINKDWLISGIGEMEEKNTKTALEEIAKNKKLNDFETDFVQQYLNLSSKNKKLVLDIMKRINADNE